MLKRRNFNESINYKKFNWMFFFNEAIIVWSIRVLNLFNNEWKIKLNQFN